MDRHWVEELLADELGSLKTLAAVAIYGSWAKQDLHDQSDIDLLLLARPGVRWSEVRAVLDRLEPVVGRELNMSGYSLDDFLGKGISPYGFLARVLAGPLVPLIGDPRALRPPHRSKDYVPRVARDRGIKYTRHRGQHPLN